MKEEGDAGERMECEGREEMRGRGHRREGGLQGVGVGLTVGGGLCSGMMQHGTHRGGHTLHTHAHTPYTATHPVTGGGCGGLGARYKKAVI